MFRRGSRLYLLLLISGYAIIALVYQGYSRLPAQRDSVESYIDSSQPVSALDVQILADTGYLSGSLIFLEQRGQPYYRILQFDFASQSLHSIFDIPSGALLYQISASPDNQSLLMSYSPPSENVTPTHNGLYRLNLRNDNPEPELILVAPENNFFAYPQWSSDGNSIYYVVYSTTGDNRNRRRIEGLNVLSGEIEFMLDDATLPALNRDNSVLAYIHINPQTDERSIRLLNLIDNIDSELVAVGDYPDLDSPLFNANDLYFAVLDVEVGDARRIGAVVYAHNDHNQPADWFRFTISTGDIEQITDTELVLKSGAFSNSGRYLASVSTLGVYITDLSDSSTEHILRSRAIRSLIWLDE